MYVVPLRQNTRCSRSKDPEDKLETPSPPLLPEKLLKLGEIGCKHWVRKVHPSTCLQKEGGGGRKNLKKENSLSEAYVVHSLFPFLYTFFSSPAIFRNEALSGVAGLTDWHVLLRISLNIGTTLLL